MRFHTIAALVLSLASTIAFANHEEGPKGVSKKLEPATRYSGPSPIDLSNGITGNNGTYGVPNQTYEEWAKQKKVVPGINDAAYPFEQKEQLTLSLDEQVMWGETAIKNWKNVATDKEEVKAYAKQAAETMDPLLAKLKDAAKSVRGAGKNDWGSAEEGARKALSDFRVGYKALHNNVSTH